MEEERSEAYLPASKAAALLYQQVREWLQADAGRVLVKDQLLIQFDANTLAEPQLAELGIAVREADIALLTLRESYQFAVLALSHLIQPEDQVNIGWLDRNEAQWKRLTDYYIRQAEWVMIDVNRAQAIDQLFRLVRQRFHESRPLSIDKAFCDELIAKPVLDLAEAHRMAVDLATFTSREYMENGWTIALVVLNSLVSHRPMVLRTPHDYQRLHKAWASGISLTLKTHGGS